MADGEWQTVSGSRYHPHSNHPQRATSHQHTSRAGNRRSYPPAAQTAPGKPDLEQNWRNKGTPQDHQHRSDVKPQGTWKQGRPQHKPSQQQQQQQQRSQHHPKPPQSQPQGPSRSDSATTAFFSQTREGEGDLFDNVEQGDASDNDSGDDSDASDTPAPIDLPLPPYHTTIVVYCPFDECPAMTPFTDTTALVKHLKEQHHTIFLNIHHMYIALDRYISHWAKEIQDKGLDAVAVNTGEGIYIIDPNVSAEDKELRDKLQRKELNEILRIQDRERHEDSKLPRKCLFCKNMCDSRTALFKHMFGEHNFNIGLPDNLVNVNDFLDMLEGKLTNLQCLYCEKIFTTPAVLRKHMRKKKHFKIAAKNRLYDPFYVINYLEPGKNWENFESERYESDEDRRDDSWADWDEAEAEPTMCLFDNTVLPSPKEALDHMRDMHGFDLTKIKGEKGLDFYKTVTLINYIRHQTSLYKCYSCGATFDDLAQMTSHMQEAGCFVKVPDIEAGFWKDQKYLFPTYDNDPLLTGFDDGEDDDEPMDPEARTKLIAQYKEELARATSWHDIVEKEDALASEVEAVTLEIAAVGVEN